MSVYVDDARIPYRNMTMCHMFADTLEELHEMADLIGIDRKWFQDKKYKHYDICLSKRKKAVTKGAIEITSKDIVIMFRPRKNINIKEIK